MSSKPSIITLGKFASVFGIKGWIKIQSFTDPAENIFTYPSWLLQKRNHWHPIEVEEHKHHGKGYIVKVKNYDNREDAKALTNLNIGIQKSDLASTNADEFYWSDLMGMEVYNRQEQHLGTVVQLIETASNDVFIVDGDNKRHLIPHVTDVVDHIDLKEKKITVDWDKDF
jgi:16S rRNA processing protein RimM